MSARILKFGKGFLDCVDGSDVRFTAALPPPRGREIYPGLFTKLGQRDRVNSVEALHDSLVKELPIMGVTKQWADTLHFSSRLALTQCLLLTYVLVTSYITCVNAIRQEKD